MVIVSKATLLYLSIHIYVHYSKANRGRKRNGFAKAEPNHIYRFSLLAAKESEILTQKRSKIRPSSRHKSNLQIRKSISDFAASIGEIITDMPYLCEPEVSEQKRAIFLFSPSFEDKLRLKVLNLRFSAKNK